MHSESQLEMLAPMPSDADYEALADAVLTPENLFHASAKDGGNVFLTGAGGTGKSTQLRGPSSRSVRAASASPRRPAWRR